MTEATGEPDYSLALEEARREFAGLDAQLQAIRDRAGQVLGIGVVALTVTGGVAALEGGQPVRWAVGAGCVLVAVVAGVCAFVWWPRQFRSAVVPARAVWLAERPGMTGAELRRELALDVGVQLDRARPKLRLMYRLQQLPAPRWPSIFSEDLERRDGQVPPGQRLER